MPRPLKIDFVSDVVCPWCAIGLASLNAALKRMSGEVEAEITFHPFELNPNMGPEGENIVDHIGRKYGSTPEQSAANREMIHARAAEVGFDMRMSEDSHIWNTFDAHRLLHWAGQIGPLAQGRLKKALLTAHFTGDLNISDHAVLAAIAGAAGLDPSAAAEVLTSNHFALETREEMALWLKRGVNSVPAVVIEDKWLISGGQPVAVFEEALRGIAKEVAA